MFYIKMVITDNVQIFILQAINILMVSHSQCSENCKPSPMLLFHCKASSCPPVILLKCHKVCIFSTYATNRRTNNIKIYRSASISYVSLYHYILFIPLQENKSLDICIFSTGRMSTGMGYSRERRGCWCRCRRWSSRSAWWCASTARTLKITTFVICENI